MLYEVITMKENNRPLPNGYKQIKSEKLRSRHFKNMNALHKIDYLYSVQAAITREEFFDRLKKLHNVL